jgi:MFS family permease
VTAVTTDAPKRRFDISQGSALRFVVLFGFVSLLADMTYEGARSITGPWLALMGASAAAVGFVAGLGELLGYTLRIVSGFLVDRTGRYWLLTLIGYTSNLIAVPLMAIAGRWELASLLIVAERSGKAIRVPSRDAMLSHATSAMGRGLGFGLHEAMDRTGAMMGPLVVAGVLFLVAQANGQASSGYQTAFAILAIPALLALGALAAARALYPNPRDLEVKKITLERGGLSRAYWLYVVAVACIAAGYADFPLIAYHLQKNAVMAPTLIPILYAAAMAVSGISALLFGRLFDKLGAPALIAAALLSSVFAPLTFSFSPTLALVGMILWGIGMGAQNSVMRAAIADLVGADRRGSAYGLFNTAYGVAWFLGSTVMGLLYDQSLVYLVVFSVTAQLLSIPLLLWVRRDLKTVAAKKT